MPRNAVCRLQLREVLRQMSVGDEFTLAQIVVDMSERKFPERRRTMQQPMQRVAMILTEYVNLGILSRVDVKSGTTTSFRVSKSVE